MSGGPSSPGFALPPPELWERAKALRAAYWDRRVHLRGIVEFSNHCRRNCLYCGLRRDNAALARYRLGEAEILACARTVRKLGFGTLVLQSGEDPEYASEEIAEVIRKIKTEIGLAVTLSLGERSRAEYRLWREAGADRYLLKMETMNAALYAKLRPERRLEERLEAFHTLRALGYETGSGLIAALPGERAEDAERDIELLAGFGPDMFSISPFTPHPDTPLGGSAACGATETLRRMALARLAAPRAHIPVTSALGLFGDAVRLAALQVGDVLMPSLTPESVREAYAIYPGKNRQEKTPAERAAQLRDMLPAAGFSIAPGPGGVWREEEA